MADITKTVSIIFGGIDEFSQVAKTASKSLENFAGSVADVTAPFDALADKALKTEAAITLLAAGIVGMAVKTAGSFQDSFGEISTLIEDTAENIDKFGGDVLAYGTTSRAALEDVNRAVYSAISAGVDYRNSLEFLNESEKLSVAGRADLNDTTILLASALNAYGESTDKAGKYSDIFFETVRLGQTTIPELAQSLAQVTSISAGAKIPIETLMAAIAALTAAGMDTPQAITAMKGAISAIISPTSEASKAAKDLGIEFSANALASKGLEIVLRDVMEATGGNVEQINTLFGNVRGLSGVLSLATNDSERFRDSLEAMKNSAGSTSTAYEKVADDFGKINQTMANNFEVAMIMMGQRVLGSYGGVVGSITDIFKGVQIGIAEGAFDPVFAAINEFGTDAAACLAAIAENLPEALKIVDYADLVASYENLGSAVKNAFEALFGDIDLSTPEGLAAALQKVVNAIAMLTNVSSGIVEGLTPFLKALGMAIDKSTELDSGTAELIGKFLGLAKGVHSLFSNIEILTSVMAILAGSSVVNTVAAMVRFAASSQAVSSALGLLSGGLGLLTGAGGLLALGAGGLWLLDKAVEANADRMNGMISGVKTLVGSFLGLNDANQKATESFGLTAEEIEAAGDEMQNLRLALSQYAQTVEGMGPEGAKAFADSAEEVRREITRLAVEMNLPVMRVDVDATELVDAGETLKKELPDRKTVKADVELEKDKIKAQRDLLEKAMEIKARINTAEIEAATKRFVAMFDSIKTGIESTGETTVALWEVLGGGGLGISQRMELESYIEAENERRQQEFDLQRQLIEQQVALNQLKIEAMERGDALITIDGSGLQPHLEAFMWEVLEAIQIRANATGAEFLLGM